MPAVQTMFADTFLAGKKIMAVNIYLSYILIDMIRMEEDRLTSALESIGGLPRKELNL